MSLRCKGCGCSVEPGLPILHAPGCPVVKERRLAKEHAEIVERILADPKAYRTYLTRTIAEHVVKLGQLGNLGSHRAAQQFREAALDVMELLDAAEGKGGSDEAASISRGGATRHRRSKAQGGTDPAPEAVGEPPVAVAPGEGYGREPGDLDEG